MAHISLNIRLILIAIITFSTVKFMKTDMDVYRLNAFDFKPLHYDVKLEFNLYKNVVFGECNLTIFISDQAKMITINNSAIFAIYEIYLINNNTQIINIPKLSFSKKEYIRIDLTKIYPSLFGIYTLKMIYICTMSDDKNFIESLYMDEDKDSSVKLMTAAELFPCWELSDARFQATFKISVRHNKRFIHLSNILTREEVKDTVENMMWTHYNKSSLMLASNLEFMMHTLISTTNSTENITFWCKKELIDQVDFAETIARGIVNYLNQKSTRQMTKINYFIIDNFHDRNQRINGFILLRADDIVYDYKLDDINHKVDMANLVAYQTISHWYKDIILWSKDGFITFLATHILQQAQLYKGIMDLFVVQIQQESLRFDTLPNVESLPPITDIVTDQYSTYHTFRSSFHFIKSSVIWRLFYHLILSDDVFWISINNYVQSNETSLNNFWDIAQIALNKTGNRRKIILKKLLTTWITEKPCPEVFVERIDEYEINVEYPYGQDSKQECPMLVTYITSQINEIRYFLLFMSKETIIHSNLRENDWLLANIQQSGYFRVNYSIENWQSLSHYLYRVNHTGIHVINRAQIIDDSFHFLMERQFNFTMFWTITSFLFNETDYIAWYPMIKAVEYMTCVFPMIQNNHVMDKLKVLFNELLQNIGYYNYININDSDYTICLRQEARKWACVLGDIKCRTTATSELIKDLSDRVQTKLFNWREWIYCKGLMEANESIWNNVFDRGQKTNDTALFEYLVCTKNPNTASRYLMVIMKNDFLLNIKNNIRAYIILLIIARHAKNYIMLEYILENLKAIEFTFKKHVDYVVILNVIITHEHSIVHFRKINEFVNTDITDIKIINAVKNKINQRKSHYQKQVTYYGNIHVYKRKK